MKSALIGCAIPTLLLLGGLAPLASADTHLQNGNFEQGEKNKFPGWTLDPAEGLQEADGVTGKCIWLNHNGSLEHDPSLAQNMTNLKPGSQYVVSGKYKVGKTGNIYAKPGEPMLAVEIDKVRKVASVAPASKTDPKKIDDTEWLTFSVGFTASGATHNLKIKGEIDGKDADVYVDDVAVSAVPPVLTHGNFDSEMSFDGWKLENVEAIVANQHEVLADGTKNGFVWLNFDGGQKDPAIIQDLNNLKPGTTYIVTGKYRTGRTAHSYNIKPGDPLLLVDIDGKAINEPAVAPASIGDSGKLDQKNWMSFSATFKAAKQSHTLRIRGEVNGKDGDVAVDDISVAELGS